MKKSKIVVATYGDWIAIYINGILEYDINVRPVVNSHAVSPLKFLKKLKKSGVDIKFKVKKVDEYWLHDKIMPDKLKKVKFFNKKEAKRFFE